MTWDGFRGLRDPEGTCYLRCYSHSLSFYAFKYPDILTSLKFELFIRRSMDVCIISYIAGRQCPLSQYQEMRSSIRHKDHSVMYVSISTWRELS